RRRCKWSHPRGKPGRSRRLVVWSNQVVVRNSWLMAENVTVEMHSQVPVRMSSAGRLFAELHDQVAAWSSDHEARAAVRISPEDGGILEVVAEQSRVS